jgi:hypothetical protein
MSLAVLLGLVGAAGCAPPASRGGSPAAWNPSYWAAIGSDIRYDAAANPLHALSWRSGLPVYWRLVRTVLETSSGAECVFVVEQPPQEDESHYWWVLLVGRADGATVYRGGSNPFDMVGMGGANATDEEREVVRSVAGAEALPVPAETMGKLLAGIREAEVWKAPSEVYRSPLENLPVDAPPVLVHAWRGRGNRWTDFLLTSCYVTPRAIRGDFTLQALGDPREAWCHFPVFGLPPFDKLDAKRRGAATDRFARSLPARVVLNGVLMALYHGAR